MTILADTRFRGGFRFPGGVRFLLAALPIAAFCALAPAGATSQPAWDKENEARLAKLIHETIASSVPKPTSAPADLDKLMPWSAPVNGLRGKIDCVVGPGIMWGGDSLVLVRLQNVRNGPVVVATGNSDSNQLLVFELYHQYGNEWRSVSCSHKSAQPQLVTLEPNQSCLAFLWSNAPRRLTKVILRQGSLTRENAWEGILETPVFAPRATDRKLKQMHSLLPFPDKVPRFTMEWTAPVFGGNAYDPFAPDPDEVTRLSQKYRGFVEALVFYDALHIGREIEERMLAEQDHAVKLFLAAVAAPHGSEKSALLLLQMMKETDYQEARWVNNAIALAMESYGDDPPEWIVALIELRVTDDRLATGFQKFGLVQGPSLRAMAESDAGGLVRLLGQNKSKLAVPFLLSMVARLLPNGPKTSDGGAEIEPGVHAIEALGRIGDPNAIAVLLTVSKKNARHPGERDRSDSRSDVFSSTIRALGQLRAQDAVPFLLEYVDWPEAIEALTCIGDPRSVPVLQRLVADKGKVIIGGKVCSPECEEERLVWSKVGLAWLEGEKGVKPIGELLIDEKAIGNCEFVREWIIDHLEDSADPNAVHYLSRTIEGASCWWVVLDAIEGLGSLKNKDAVQALISAFDIDFAEKTSLKGLPIPAFYRSAIVESLQEITGQLGLYDKEEWIDWWKKQHGVLPGGK